MIPISDTHLHDTLDKIHRQIRFRFGSKNKANQSRKKAQQIQQILQQIKHFSEEVHTTSKDPLIQKLTEENVQIILEAALDAFNNSPGRRGTGRTQSLFYARHQFSNKNKNTRYGGDDIAEEHIAAIMTGLENLYSGRSGADGNSVANKLIGGDTSSINLSKELDTMIVEAMKTVGKVSEKYINEQGQMAVETYNKLHAKSGKADVQGTNVDILGEDVSNNPLVAEVLRVFNGITFTVKNYASLIYDKDTGEKQQSSISELHLGNSDYFKSIYGPLSQIGYSQKDIETIFYRGINCGTIPHAGTTVFTHFYHIRYVYELQGLGLFDENCNPITAPEYIIYNDPDSDFIYVRSCYDIINEVLDSEDNKDFFVKSIGISKNSFI